MITPTPGPSPKIGGGEKFPKFMACCGSCRSMPKISDSFPSSSNCGKGERGLGTKTEIVIWPIS